MNNPNVMIYNQTKTIKPAPMRGTKNNANKIPLKVKPVPPAFKVRIHQGVQNPRSSLQKIRPAKKKDPTTTLQPAQKVTVMNC